MSNEQEFLVEIRENMQKSVDSFGRDLNTVRTGRASPALVEGIMVDYYGSSTSLSHIASISVPEAKVLMIEPWDKQALTEVEKSLLKSDLGLVPNTDGSVIRLNIPVLTEERRRDLVKVVRAKLEEGHIAVRNIRRNGLAKLRQDEKDKLISQDDSRRIQGQLQELTDSIIEEMDIVAKDKESEVMEV